METQDSNRPAYQALVNIAEICHQKGMTAIVLSPGSRSAPLAISFWRHSEFECRVVPDERSAAYQALGMASWPGLHFWNSAPELHARYSRSLLARHTTRGLYG